MDEPDYSLPVTYRLPPEGKLVQVWFAGHDNRWAYAVRRGLVWMVDSRELPGEVIVGQKLITHWRDAPPEPGEIYVGDFFDTAADIVLEAMPAERLQGQDLLPGEQPKIQYLDDDE